MGVEVEIGDSFINHEVCMDNIQKYWLYKSKCLVLKYK